MRQQHEHNGPMHRIRPRHNLQIHTQADTYISQDKIRVWYIESNHMAHSLSTHRRIILVKLSGDPSQTGQRICVLKLLIRICRTNAQRRLYI